MNSESSYPQVDPREAKMIAEGKEKVLNSTLWIKGPFVHQGELFSVNHDSEEIFPFYQFDRIDGNPLPVIKKILDVFKNKKTNWQISDKIGLNEISVWWQVNNVDKKYIEQFYQLIGYSIRGYEELDAVSDENFERASEIASKLTGEQNQ